MKLAPAIPNPDFNGSYKARKEYFRLSKNQNKSSGPQFSGPPAPGILRSSVKKSLFSDDQFVTFVTFMDN